MARQFQVLRGGRFARSNPQGTESSCPTGFEDLLLAHLDGLFAFAMRLVAGRRDQAEDLVQQACLQAFQAYAGLRSRERARGWFFKILVNTYINDFHKRTREVLAAEESLRALVKARTPKEVASAALRETVLTRIAEERASALPADPRRAMAVVRRPLAWAVAALVLACGIMVGLWLMGYRNQVAPQPLIMLLVEDHLGNLSRATEIATSDPDTMQKWFQQKVGFTFRLPATTEPQLIGGRLCFLQGRKPR